MMVYYRLEVALQHAADLNLIPRQAASSSVASSVQRFRNRSQTVAFTLELLHLRNEVDVGFGCCLRANSRRNFRSLGRSLKASLFAAIPVARSGRSQLRSSRLRRPQCDLSSITDGLRFAFRHGR